MNKPIRILHILYGLNRGGAETMLINYYKEMDKKLVQFDFLISNPQQCDYENEVLALGGYIYRIPSLSKKPFAYLKALNSFIKNHPEYCIIHSHNSAKNTIPLGIAKFQGVSVRISHSHNIRNESGIVGLIKNMLRPFVRFVSTDNFACGKKAGKWLYGERTYERTGVLLKNAIDTQKYSFSQGDRDSIRKQRAIDDYFIIGSIGRFYPQKNHLFLLDIFNAIHKTIPKSKLLLIGDGVLKKEIEEKIVKLDLKKDVILTGVVDNVNEYMQAMDVFLLPSIYEGLPLVLIEAQASGLKCFVSKNVVTEESDITGLVNYISLSESPQTWANKIIEGQDYERKNTYQKIIESGYDIKKSVQWLQDYYLSKYIG